MGHSKLYKRGFSEDVFRDNEIRSNYSNCIYSLLFAIIMTLLLLFYDYSIYSLGKVIVCGLLIIIFMSIISIIVCHRLQARKPWIKNMFMFLFILAAAFCTLFSSSGVISLIVVIPIALSCRYYSVRFTLITSLLSIIIVESAIVVCAYFGISDMADLNYIQILPGMSVQISGSIYSSFKEIANHVIDRTIYTKRLIAYELIPIDCLLAIFVTICAAITSRGKRMVLKQAEISNKQAKIQAELNMAANIQKDMLASEFPSSNRYDLFACMNPAKEVGGDFYDYCVLDESHIAIMIGDVSDKGVPAALFMSECATNIHTFAQLGYSPDVAFTEINKRLCVGNEEGMFVTSILAIIDTNTGMLTYANAGHCAPLIKHKSGECEYLKMEKDLFLGSIADIKYQKQTYQLAAGDQILLYTDGVSEAMNNKEELYGKDRLKNFMSGLVSNNASASLNEILGDISKFVGQTEQNDDITMLLFEYREA